MDVLSRVTEKLPDLADILVYAAIAIVTIIGVIKCLMPLWGTTHALRNAIRHLQDDAGNNRDKPVWQETRFMGRRLKGYWLRFLQNAEQLDRRGLPCNVEDYINDDTVTHGPGNAPLADMIPNLLTSLGILGTFMGMMRGLSGLDISNAANITSSISNLLDGMRFAFGTSVAGVSCSIVFNMLNRIAQGSSYRAIDDFVESFTQLAMQRPLDNDVQLICQNQDSNHLLSTITDTMPAQLAGSIEMSVSRALHPVAQSMDNFLVGATRSQVEGVSRIVSTFVTQMNASLNNQLLALGQTLTEVNQHQQMTMERVERSLSATEAMADNVGQLHGVSQEVMNHFEAYVRELGDARRRDEHFEAATSELLGKLQQASDHQSTALRQLNAYQNELTRALDLFRQQSQDAIAGMNQSQSDAAAQLAGVSKTMKASSNELSQSYQTFVQHVVEGLSRSLGMFDESMHSVIATLSDAVENASGADTTARMSEIQRLLTSMQESLQRAADALDRPASKEA